MSESAAPTTGATETTGLIAQLAEHMEGHVRYTQHSHNLSVEVTVKRLRRSLAALDLVIVPASEVVSPELRAAIGRAVGFIEAFCRPNPELPPLAIFSDDDLALLARFAAEGAT